MRAHAEDPVGLSNALALVGGQFLSAREAQRLDEQLMGVAHGFSLDQLMELAGLSVACAVGTQFPAADSGSATSSSRVLVVAGPGNNGYVWASIPSTHRQTHTMACGTVWVTLVVTHSWPRAISSTLATHLRFCTQNEAHGRSLQCVLASCPVEYSNGVRWS